MAEVQLLQATKVPAGYMKMERAKVDHWEVEELSLFTPCSSVADLVLADAAVELDNGCWLTLILENHGHTPVQLEKGMVLAPLETNPLG